MRRKEIDVRTLERLDTALAQKPRVRLGNLPTPLEEAPRLSERLGIRVLLKRDDLTGFALGGNKVRKLEFLIADALALGADTIVTTGGSQSNHARLTSAACRRFGLECHLVLDRGVHPEIQGNLLLDTLLGAHVHMIEESDPAAAVSGMDALAKDLRRDGYQPYVVPRGGSVPQGAIGYAAFVLELAQQLEESSIPASHLYLGTGSTGTHSGVLAGTIASRASWRVQGISVSRPGSDQIEKVTGLTSRTLAILGLPEEVSDDIVHVDDAYRGPAYGVPTSQTMEAIKIAARDEGVILDPVYTGKAMAGLIGHARDGRLRESDIVVFLHTGGAPALFAYNQEVAGAVQASTW